MSDNWKEQIIKQFIPKVNWKWVVFDYDFILANEEIAYKIQNKGFSLIEYNDPLRFRYEYEKQYRDFIESENEIIIIVHDKIDLHHLPFDIICGSRIISLELSNLFPQIDISVLRLISHDQYELLQDSIEYEKLSAHESLSLRDSVIFVLQAVFGIYLISIRDDITFARLLFRIHSKGLHFPELFISHIVEYFNSKNKLKNWNISILLTSSDAFWKYIQSVFAYKVYGKIDSLSLGPFDLDIFNYELLVYLDNAFIDGKLQPLTVNEDIYNKIPRSLQGIGVINRCVDISETTEIRIKELFYKLQTKKIDSDSSYIDWFSLAQLYFVWCNLREQTGEWSEQEKIFKININEKFSNWICQRFDSLCYESVLHPIMGTGVLPYLQKEFSRGHKIAFIVIDGMSYSDWITMKNSLPANKYSYYENFLFSWIPSVTSVSRQVLFSGKLPKFFGDKIHTTSNEKNEWDYAWLNKYSYLKKDDIYYAKNLGYGSVDIDISSIGNPYILGIVVNTIDDLMHGPQVSGMKGFHANIKIWMENGYLEKLLDKLLDDSYSIFITSDHGHTECTGIGKLNEGDLVEDKGQRVRSYMSVNLRDSALGKTANSLAWDSSSLPNNYNALLAEYGKSFSIKGKNIITHGGISLDENIVPWIEVKHKHE